MRGFLLPILIAVAALPTQAQASRCVDQVVMFAQRLDVSIGAPGRPKASIVNPEFDASTAKAHLPIGAVTADGHMGNGEATLLESEPAPSESKPSGPALKARAKAVLSSLLNAALAAGEEGRSRACFEQLNVALAVSLASPHEDGVEDVRNWP